MTEFNHCPNCRRAVSGGLFGAAYKVIYQCKNCKTYFCHKCGGKLCPDCGSDRRREAGKAYAKKK